MDGSQFIPDVRTLGWGKPARSSAPARPQLFLQRDLSEQALSTPPDPSFNEAELAAARQAGFEAGHAVGLAAGLADAAAAREAAEAAALAVIADELTASHGEAARIADDVAGAAAAALVTALDAVMPELMRRCALSEAGAMLALLLPAMPQEPHVQVRLEPALADGVARLVDSLPPDRRPGVTITAGSAMQPGEVQIRWAAGRAERRPADIWQSVMQAFAPALPDLLALPDINETQDLQPSEISNGT